MSLLCCQCFVVCTATANTLSFCLVSLAYHPELQAQARQEVQETLATTTTTSVGSSSFTYELLKQLPFTWQIFREALRLFPTVPVMVFLLSHTRVTPPCLLLLLLPSASWSVHV